METVLHNFSLSAVGAAPPASSLISDASGNLYGTAGGGSGTNCGAGGCGTVFEMSPKQGDGWGMKVIHTFTNNGKDGYQTSFPLLFDAAGNLYGTTVLGGAHAGGAVFELMPKAGGGWTERIVYSFNGSNTTRGAFPDAGLAIDSAGNLYGTTLGGGSGAASGAGTVFVLKPAVSGWTESVLYSFLSNGADGTVPQAGVTLDSLGNIYGTTSNGGAHNYGTVFELSPAPGGGWTELVLHSFDPFANEGGYPYGGLALDSSLSLYGTTFTGGSAGFNCSGQTCGTVFQLSKNSKGEWALTTLHSFGVGSDGQRPESVTPIIDSLGNLYGTTSAGGDYGYGTVFELSPGVGGVWTETLLHSFGQGKDGQSPAAGLIFDSAGNLYGTTVDGGAAGGGIAFEIAH
jgi:uncharacterized repeat protein (TIGR03803 family)